MLKSELIDLEEDGLEKNVKAYVFCCDLFLFALFQVQAEVNGKSGSIATNPALSVAGPADASIQIDYTIGTTSTGANVANVTFACAAANASGLLLTNLDGSGNVQTGYVSNSTAYVQTVASPAADTHYKAITVTVTATLTTGMVRY